GILTDPTRAEHPAGAGLEQGPLQVVYDARRRRALLSHCHAVPLGSRSSRPRVRTPPGAMPSVGPDRSSGQTPPLVLNRAWPRQRNGARREPFVPARARLVPGSCPARERAAGRDPRASLGGRGGLVRRGSGGGGLGRG